MRRIVALGLCVLSLALAAPAGADGPTAGGMTSDNFEFIRHIAIAQDGVGGSSSAATSTRTTRTK